NNQNSAVAFGTSGDIPVAADYDGDGKADVAVFRPSNGIWYLQRSQLGFTGIAFGTIEDKPVPADYDGDGKADVAVFRPSN
ncbi:MAG: FG-GAP repeat domain-containing protein, partial [Pyrinomonadaceae bacterium]